ncbi:uncharacterized protein DDB_G0290685-like [Papaver somniferum]|uniref:uncharacterized protein DDB_G0290685-like n=1 Tax=Papaver somniferum TaxID=3469 RepID=UPI000E6F757B|nr:uncharacterized protein DDB_G0290685-like [Papaver somniferum]
MRKKKMRYNRNLPYKEEESDVDSNGDGEDDGNGSEKEEGLEEEEEDEGNNGGDEKDDDDGGDKVNQGKDDGDKDDEEDEGDDGGNKVGEEIEQPKNKRRVKNDGTDIASRARHIPPEHLQLKCLSNGKARGEPRYGCEVLFRYRGSWACTIYETIEHRNVVRLFRHQSSFRKMELWPLDKECARVRA